MELRRTFVVPLFVACLCLFPGPQAPAQLFDIPLRINMGGIETVDSLGNTWLGDLDLAAPCNGDPLNIRPDDSGGCNAIENWGVQAGGDFMEDTLANIGFDPAHPGDQYIFDSIRWDLGGDGIDFRLELPVPNGAYVVNCYFAEECCTQRHFKIELQGVIVDDDVSYLDYDPDLPGLGRVGRLRFPGIFVDDEILRITFLPCPECPEPIVPIDTNAIIDAIEVLADSSCTGPDFNFACSFDAGANRVNATWDPVPGAETYRVLKNGVVFLNSLPGGATSFSDNNPGGGQEINYTLQALDGGVAFAECSCRVRTFACPRGLTCTFDAPSGEARLAWTAALNVDVTSFEIRGNGALLATVPGSQSSYADRPTERQVQYEVTPITSPAGRCNPLSCNVINTSFHYDVPFRVNAGGPEVTDSLGRVWQGDEGFSADPLGIRPVDNGGREVIGAGGWCNPAPDAVDELGFDSTNPSDVLLFQSIRWDNAAVADDFLIEIPLENDNYNVTFYFCEACCDQRHFKIEMEGVLYAEDVHRADYATALHRPGRYQFVGVIVTDGVLNIGLLPCPECAGAGDTNAILTALEVVAGDADPCETPGFRVCPGSLSCTIGGGGVVTGTWTAPLCITPTGYQVLKDGAVLQNLPGSATSFTDTLTVRAATYEVVPILGAGQDPCRTLSCSVVNEGQPFAIPLRINLGGRGVVDSLGRRWLGDPGAGADPLSIRPDDLGATNTIENWCDSLVLTNRDSLQSLGLNPYNRNDLHIFDSLRWDLGDDDADGIAGELNDPDGGDIDYRLLLPVPNGTYLLNLYFTECCCDFRHFQVEIQGEVREEDVSSARYSQGGDLGRTGRFSFPGIVVSEEVLEIVLRPCVDPVCLGGTDTNAILNALELLPSAPPSPRCPRDLLCVADLEGTISGTWSPGEGVTPTGYRLLRDGEQIATLPGNATSFIDSSAPCARAVTYELDPQLPAGPDPCPGLQLICTIIDTTCPFEGPFRINMAGHSVFDSRGELWLGDFGPSLDPLEIRPDDIGGARAEEFWFRGSFQKASLVPLGFDPDHQGNEYIFNTIRWDEGPLFPDWLMEIPVANGEYDINMYFNEGCCPNRHFQISIQDVVVDEDVSYLDYVAEPALGKVGRLTFQDIEVADEILRIGLLPCPACPGATDTNAILDGLEILPGDLVPPQPVFLRGDTTGEGNLNITDGVNIFNWLFLGGSTPGCLEAANPNDAATINITSGVYLLNFLFLGGPPPPAPGPPGPGGANPCGPDPVNSPSHLGCVTYNGC